MHTLSARTDNTYMKTRLEEKEAAEDWEYEQMWNAVRALLSGGSLKPTADVAGLGKGTLRNTVNDLREVVDEEREDTVKLPDHLWNNKLEIDTGGGNDNGDDNPDDDPDLGNGSDDPDPSPLRDEAPEERVASKLDEFFDKVSKRVKLDADSMKFLVSEDVRETGDVPTPSQMQTLILNGKTGMSNETMAGKVADRYDRFINGNDVIKNAVQNGPLTYGNESWAGTGGAGPSPPQPGGQPAQGGQMGGQQPQQPAQQQRPNLSLEDVRRVVRETVQSDSGPDSIAEQAQNLRTVKQELESTFGGGDDRVRTIQKEIKRLESKIDSDGGQQMAPGGSNPAVQSERDQILQKVGEGQLDTNEAVQMIRELEAGATDPEVIKATKEAEISEMEHETEREKAEQYGKAFQEGMDTLADAFKDFMRARQQPGQQAAQQRQQGRGGGGRGGGRNQPARRDGGARGQQGGGQQGQDQPTPDTDDPREAARQALGKDDSNDKRSDGGTDANKQLHPIPCYNCDTVIEPDLDGTFDCDNCDAGLIICDGCEAPLRVPEGHTGMFVCPGCGDPEHPIECDADADGDMAVGCTHCGWEGTRDDLDTDLVWCDNCGVGHRPPDASEEGVIIGGEPSGE